MLIRFVFVCMTAEHWRLRAEQRHRQLSLYIAGTDVHVWLSTLWNQTTLKE